MELFSLRGFVAKENFTKTKSLNHFINQDLLLRIVNSFFTSKDYDEELKIDIANAMSKGELGIQGEDYQKD